MTDPTAPGSLLSLEQVAEMFGKTPRWIRQYVRRRSIPALKAGRSLLFDEIAVSAMKEAMRQPLPARSSDLGARPATAGRSPAAIYTAVLKSMTDDLEKRKLQRSKRPRKATI